jgi:glycopeptide antibiotics resistance protein
MIVSLMPLATTSRSRLRFAGAMLIAYAVAVLAVTLWPSPVDQGFESQISRGLAALHRRGLPSWFGYNALEFSANMALFVPLGFLIALLLPARFWWLALFVCPAISTSIELTQGAFLASRFATVSDIAANSLGGIIGVVVSVIVRALFPRIDRDPSRGR